MPFQGASPGSVLMKGQTNMTTKILTSSGSSLTLTSLIHELGNTLTAKAMLNLAADTYAWGDPTLAFFGLRDATVKALGIPYDFKAEEAFNPLRDGYIDAVAEAYFNGFRAAVKMISEYVD